MDAHTRVAHCSGMQSHPGSNVAERPLLSVVDDDESVRESLPDLLREFGFSARTFSSAEEFLSSDCIAETRCLILDVVMPGMSGLELYHELMRRGRNIPVVFITAQPDETVRARMFAHGAAGFLLKPFSDTDLLAAVNIAVCPQ
jgi:FixJ family two-component response regulator